MRRRKRKASTKTDMIIALALLHRYGWIIAMLVCMAVVPVNPFYTVCAFVLLFSLWSFVGYKLRWKHIYCSYQNAYRKKMTPDIIHWNFIKKRDAYGEPIIFLILGIVMLITGALC